MEVRSKSDFVKNCLNRSHEVRSELDLVVSGGMRLASGLGLRLAMALERFGTKLMTM